MQSIPQINLLTATVEEFDEFLKWMETQSEARVAAMSMCIQRQGDVLVEVETVHTNIKVTK